MNNHTAATAAGIKSANRYVENCLAASHKVRQRAVHAAAWRATSAIAPDTRSGSANQEGIGEC